MTHDSTSHRGVVHGRTIELSSDAGLPEGQVVDVTLQPVADEGSLPPGEGIRRSEGAWDDDPDGLEEYLAWNRQQRKASRGTLES